MIISIMRRHGRCGSRGGWGGVMSGARGAAEDAADRQEEIELLVADLKEVLGVEFDRRVSGEVEDAFNETAVLAEDF